MKRCWALPVFLLMSNAAFGCEGEQLQVKTAASTAGFTVTQGGAPFSGEFRRFGGKICLDEHSNIGVIDAWLDPVSIDTGLPEVDELLLEEEFFRTMEFPRITFTSTSIEHDGNRVKVSGPLQINGISRVYDVAFRFEPRPARQWKASGSFTVLRLEHDLGRGEWENTDYLDNEVEVAFDAILVPVTERME